MRVIVIGAGLIGVTSAYFLRRRGYEVTVLDRQEGPGRETSFANGSLLTPSMPEPWNAPGCWRVLLESIGRSDASLQLRLSALPSLAGWGVRFLRNSSPAAFERNTVANLRLALYSLEIMESLRKETRIDYACKAAGTLKLFRDPDALDRAAAWAARLGRYGLAYRRLSAAETAAVEPALEPIANELAGAIHYQADQTGDAYRFCTELTQQAREGGVEFCFGTDVSALEMRAGRVTAVRTAMGRIPAETVVVAACSFSAPLLKTVGLSLPVRPAKGYSVTFDRMAGHAPLKIPVVDDDLHAVIVPIEDKIRVAGTAEFAGYDLTLSAARAEILVRLLDKVLPQGRPDLATARAWCGLRAMSADGRPLIGPAVLPNLFVNTGHGHLGWTMATGSAQLLTDIVCGTAPTLDAVPYDPRR